MMVNPVDYSKRKSRSYLKSILIFYGFISVFTSCAKVGSPTGGPKDENPPAVIACSPENGAVNNKTKDIEITFDEFIVLKNLNEELVISPPLKEKPITRIRSKTLVIDLNNNPADSTTYTLNFGNAIADNNEGNLLPDYEFVFSTGPFIDSLSVTGTAVNAFNLKPEKEKVFVMLYDNLGDSAPYLELPAYITKTGTNGKFAINNIRPDTFRLFALKDVNNNLKFDIPDEMIAFGDSAIIVSPENVQKINFVKDSALLKPVQKATDKEKGAAADTIAADSVSFKGKELYAVNADLFLFVEEDMRQGIIEKERESRELLTFVFNRTLFDSIQLIPLNFTAENWYLKDISQNKDTASFWITDSTLIKLDTLSLAVSYSTTDSALNFVTRTDTITFLYRIKEDKSKPGRKTKETLPDQDSLLISLSANIRNQSVANLNQSILIISPRPVSSYDIHKFSLYRFEDTLQYSQPVKFAEDTSALYTVKFSTDWTENTAYRLLVEPGAVTDIYGATNDTFEISFRTQKGDYYGRIMLSLKSREFPVIVQLTDEKENRIAEKSITKDEVVTFDFLSPKKYRFKAVIDKNGNRKWDTGNYLKHIQPEKVINYPGLMDVRSNWDVEISWSLDGGEQSGNENENEERYPVNGIR
ncbi:MAG: Ig-like domain-containing protein [Bacteroidales bacterium]|nr:Ig-like domain-containing protein [Bacteroidales bacterium]